MKNDEKAADIHMPATPQSYARKGISLKPPNIFRKYLHGKRKNAIFAVNMAKDIIDKNYNEHKMLISKKDTKEKRFPKFANFGEYLFWSYANLQMLCAALNMGKKEYDRSCFMIRAKAFKAYKEGRWNIHDLLEFNVAKIKENNYCWYCGKEMEPSKLTNDHVFPRSKGGANDMDNIIMVCKTCNSSKGNMDLFEWYCEVRKEWPPLNILIHYLKNIYLYSIDNGLMDKHTGEMNAMELPFKWQYIPLDYPQPECFM